LARREAGITEKKNSAPSTLQRGTKKNNIGTQRGRDEREKNSAPSAPQRVIFITS
jgi:hypothetical protein